jgi:hypothetical protein
MLILPLSIERQHSLPLSSSKARSLIISVTHVKSPQNLPQHSTDSQIQAKVQILYLRPASVVPAGEAQVSSVRGPDRGLCVSPEFKAEVSGLSNELWSAPDLRSAHTPNRL